MDERAEIMYLRRPANVNVIMPRVFAKLHAADEGGALH